MEETEASTTLEPLEVEVRNASVVLSVRLDETTARRLRVIAHQRGVRISDLLREAAVAFSQHASASSPVGMPYDVAFLGTAFIVEPVERTVSPFQHVTVSSGPMAGPVTRVSAMKVAVAG